MRFRFREHGSSILVSALAALFGVGLLQAVAYLNTLFGNSGGQAETMLTSVALVFIGLALYTGAVVTANTFATIVAGRTRQIALLRLLGAEARRLRTAVGGEGAFAGLAGSLIGAVAGVGLSAALLAIGVAQEVVPDLEYPMLSPLVWLPIAAVVTTTWLASLVGSRRVLTVTPAQATASAQEATHEQLKRRTGRTVFALLLLIVGAALLAIGVALGFVTPLGMLVAFFGGIGSFTGVVLGAHLIMPTVLRMTGHLFGRTAPAALAAANALRYPERSTRTTIGLVIGVTLVTTFAVAGSSYSSMTLASVTDPADQAIIEQVLNVTVAVLSALIGFSAVIAAVGMVNNLSLSVLQRTRELGLLRALGLTNSQVRAMVLIESAQMSLAAVGFGLLLGTLYGWAGAQSLMGSMSGLMAPTLPWPLLTGAAGAAIVLALVAALVPSRRATRITPMRALAVV